MGEAWERGYKFSIQSYKFHEYTEHGRLSDWCSDTTNNQTLTHGEIRHADNWLYVPWK